ncbi:MAG: hypothetical protein ACEQSK_12550 [Sphingomonadaceae bacterium]
MMRAGSQAALLGTLVLVLVLGMGLAACGPSEAQRRQAQTETLIRLGEKYVREKVREPAAARFRHQFIGKQGAPCGEVDAKDAFGAYLGYQRYIAVARDLTLLALEVAPAEFEEQWTQLCQQPG